MLFSASPSLRPFFTYYGGKHRAAPSYPPPRHRRIVEPFAGSAGYSVRHCSNDIELHDLSSDIARTWGYLLASQSEDVLSLPDITEGETVEKAPENARPLIGWWLNKATTYPGKSPSRWMRLWQQGDPRQAGRPCQFWGGGIRNRIAAQLSAIRHWSFTQGSYEDIDTTQPATWFIDPPYQQAGRCYRHGSSSIDYAALGKWCRSLPGRVIVCEQEGADWLPFVPLGTFKATGGAGRSGACTEVIYMQDS